MNLIFKVKVDSIDVMKAEVDKVLKVVDETKVKIIANLDKLRIEVYER